MARPTNANAAATKARILDVARSRFGEDGPASVSIRDVASHAGVSLGTVHHYFGTKDGLYEASVEAMYEELRGHLAVLDLSALAGDDVDATLRALMKGAFAFARDHRGTLRLLMRTVIDQGELSEPLRERYQLPTLGRGADILAALTGASPLQARLALQSLIHVVLRYALSTDRELETLTGVTGEAAVDAIEAHLIQLAATTLGPEERP